MTAAVRLKVQRRFFVGNGKFILGEGDQMQVEKQGSLTIIHKTYLAKSLRYGIIVEYKSKCAVLKR